MQYRIVARRGTLVFGGVSFSTRPAIYEMSAEEVSVIQSLYGDRLLLELVEPEPAEVDRPRGRRRGTDAAIPVTVDQVPDGGAEPEDESALHSGDD